MTGQQICLKWNSFQANILTSFETLWEEEGLVDVTLASDGECIRAHKVILSACSPFFKRLFQANPCQHPVIILQDVHFSELEALLSFVYKGEVNIDQENLPALLRAAETLQIRGLSGASEQLKEKVGVSKTSSYLPSRHSPDGSPPYKRRRSDHLQHTSPHPAIPKSPPVTTPGGQNENVGHTPSSSLDSSEQFRQQKQEVKSDESDSPIQPLLSLEEGLEEGVDGSVDLKAIAETEQLKETQVDLENEGNLKVGSSFPTFKEFENSFNEWADAGHHPMRRSASERNGNILDTDYPFLYVNYVCKHYGTPRSRGKNLRPKQHYYSQGCPVSLKVKVSLRQKKYIVRKFIRNHNHPVSAELRSQYPDRRMQINASVKSGIYNLVHSNVPPKEIQKYVKDNLDKTLHPKDVYNLIKQHYEGRLVGKLKQPCIADNVPIPDRHEVVQSTASVFHLNKKDATGIKKKFVKKKIEELESGPVSHTINKHSQEDITVSFANSNRSEQNTADLQFHVIEKDTITSTSNNDTKVLPLSIAKSIPSKGIPLIYVKKCAGRPRLVPIPRATIASVVGSQNKKVIIIQRND